MFRFFIFFSSNAKNSFAIFLVIRKTFKPRIYFFENIDRKNEKKLFFGFTHPLWTQPLQDCHIFV